MSSVKGLDGVFLQKVGTTMGTLFSVTAAIFIIWKRHFQVFSVTAAIFIIWKRHLQVISQAYSAI